MVYDFFNKLSLWWGDMNLQQLLTFVRVAETQNFTRAAELLHMTQPAVTQQIRALEDEFGQALFDRIGRSVHLTQAGEVLLDYAQRIADLFNECRTAMQDLQQVGRGRLRIGAGLTLSVFVLPALLSAYRQEYPGIDVTVTTGSTKEMINRLLSNEVDLAMVTGPAPHPNLVITKLYEDEMVLVVNRHHPFCERGEVSPEELRGESFIQFEQGSGYRSFLEDFFRRVGIAPRIRMDLDSIEAMKRMAEVGLGVTIVPRMSLRDEIAQGTLVPIKMKGVPPLVRPTTVAFRRDKYLSASMRAFLGVLERHFDVTVPGISGPKSPRQRAAAGRNA